MNRRNVQWLGILIGLMLISLAGRIQAAEIEKADKETQAKFLRFVEDDEGGGKLQTAIVTYQNADDVKVHLVAAVHVGESKYFQDLNKTFENYDVLLYELIKPKDMAVPVQGGNSDSIISVFQRLLQDVLDLSFQLDEIDYSARNFVHADLDAETFARLQSERGENIFTLMLRQILNEMAKPQQAPEINPMELVVAFVAPDRARHFKMILARQFENIEEKVAGLEGPDGSVLLTERNKAAFTILKNTIADGKKNIGVFYGAAHMKDLSQRLEAQGFKPVNTEWRTAWDMTPKEGDMVFRIVKKKQ